MTATESKRENAERLAEALERYTRRNKALSFGLLQQIALRLQIDQKQIEAIVLDLCSYVREKAQADREQEAAAADTAAIPRAAAPQRIA